MNPVGFHEIRDPVHGSIRLDEQEYRIVDHKFIQRLRRIRQLGFSHVPFPGATHTRFCHSVGVMELAGRVFDSIFHDDPFSSPQRRLELRQCLRLAALFHDLGHGPFSHAVEFAMPPVNTLDLGIQKERIATHEDYTVAILRNSSLNQAIGDHFSFTGEHVAALVDPYTPCDDFFLEKGFDLRLILSQLISSNLDVDRLDYLIRDSYFSGVRYGQVDIHWLIGHLHRYVTPENKVLLAFDRAALYAFEDFLLARLQMFLNVYFHHKSVGLELMFKAFMSDPACDYKLPSDLDEYCEVDDSHLWSHLCKVDHPYARAVTTRRPYRVVMERHGPPEEVDLQVYKSALEDAGIHVLISTSVGDAFPKPGPGKPNLMVLGSSLEGVRVDLPLTELAFERVPDRVCICRLYVAPSEVQKALSIMQKMAPNQHQPSLL